MRRIRPRIEDEVGPESGALIFAIVADDKTQIERIPRRILPELAS